MISFNPQPVYKLRQRYSKALEKIWIAGPYMEDRPGLNAENIFDFSNGLRLIISRDILVEPDKPKLHVSASWHHNTPKTADEAMKIIMDCFRLLDRRSANWQFVGQTPKGIPHWILEEVN